MNSNERQKINRELESLDNKHRVYTEDPDNIISLIFRCDMTTAQNIVNRIGSKMGIGTDPIVVLKTADALTMSQCALEELNGPANTI